MPPTTHPQPHGNAMIVGLILAAFLAALALAFATRVTANQARMENDIAGSRALELAQLATNLKIQQIWTLYKNQRTDQRVAWLGGEDANFNGVLDPGEDANFNNTLDPANAPNYQDATWISMAGGEVCTRIKVMALYKKEWTDIRFTTWSRVADDVRGAYAYKKEQRTLRFALGPAPVFDYVYFANNYGWMYGSQLYLYGAMGANGNLGFSSNPTVDGTLYAAANSALGAAGVINGSARNDTFSQYQTLGSANPLLRPTNPAAPPEDVNNNGLLDPGEDLNANGKLDDYNYPVGYDGSQPQKTGQSMEVMPYLGDLSMYKDLAKSFIRPARPDLGEPGGTTGAIVKQLAAPGLDPTVAANYVTLIDQTYGYNATHNGFTSNVDASGAVTTQNMTNKLDTTNQWKNGNVALIGTAAQPLVILGPVVISNDLVIKGVITGQGTFYVGRNTHVVGDLTYKNAPQWKQNDTDFDNTKAANKLKDGVGFGVKGNVVLGNYTQLPSGGDGWGTAAAYIQPPFTQPYVVDPSDAAIGYGNGTVGSTFNGNYTAADGGAFYTDSNTAPGTYDRRYYQSSFSNQYINSIAAKPSSIHGVFYTNHYFGGRTNNLMLYGNMVARDEAVVTDSSAKWTYDPRISKGDLSTYINLFLPRSAAYSTIMWTERPADDPTAASSDW